MAENDGSESKLGGYVVVAFVTAAIVYSCTEKQKQIISAPSPAPQQNQTAAPLVPSPPPIPKVPVSSIPKPTHFYDSVEGSTYYYARAVNDEERKKGKLAPEMIAFWYLGRDEQGHDMLTRVTNGPANFVSKCSRPCKVVHYDDGTTVGFDTDSIIGAAFADAQRGFLKKHLFPKPKPTQEPEYPWPEDSAAPPPEISGE